MAEAKNQIQELMASLAKDLVDLESIPNIDPILLDEITKIYENIYKDLIKIQRS